MMALVLNYKYKELNRYDRLMNIAKGETVTTADDLSLADAKKYIDDPKLYRKFKNTNEQLDSLFIDEWVITQKNSTTSPQIF